LYDAFKKVLARLGFWHIEDDGTREEYARRSLTYKCVFRCWIEKPDVPDYVSCPDVCGRFERSAGEGYADINRALGANPYTGKYNIHFFNKATPEYAANALETHLLMAIGPQHLITLEEPQPISPSFLEQCLEILQSKRVMLLTPSTVYAVHKMANEAEDGMNPAQVVQRYLDWTERVSGENNGDKTTKAGDLPDTRSRRVDCGKRSKPKRRVSS
jgi:hypothetical protein